MIKKIDTEIKSISPFLGRIPANVAYATQRGRMIHGNSELSLSDGSLNRFESSINLIFTSPPFPLNRKKRYGNETGDAYQAVELVTFLAVLIFTRRRRDMLVCPCKTMSLLSW